MFNAENFITYACCIRRSLLLICALEPIKTQKIKGRLFHARVMVDHKVKSEIVELPGLTRGALFHAKI